MYFSVYFMSFYVFFTLFNRLISNSLINTLIFIALPSTYFYSKSEQFLKLVLARVGR